MFRHRQKPKTEVSIRSISIDKGIILEIENLIEKKGLYKYRTEFIRAAIRLQVLIELERMDLQQSEKKTDRVYINTDDGVISYKILRKLT